MKPERMNRIINFYPEISSDEPKTIVDLGAYVGGFSSKFSKVNTNNLVIAVEPLIENFKKIIERKLDNVIPIMCAIGDKCEIKDIHIIKSKPYKSGLKVKKGWKRVDYSSRKVQTISWDNLIDSLDIKEVDFAKVNIEGSEEALLDGMTKVFPRKMIIEEHSRCNVTDLKRLKNLLHEKGYKFYVEDGNYDIYAERI